MKKQVLISLIISWLAIGLAQAQTSLLSDKPEEFVQDVTKLLAGSKNEKTIQIGTDFSTVWGSSLNDEQRTKIIAIARKMASKKYRVSPHFEYFFGTLTNAVNKQTIAGEEMTKLLNVLEKSVNQYDSKTLTEILRSTSSFFEYRALYYSHYNSLLTSGGSYTFEFREDAPAPSMDFAPDEKKEPVVKQDDQSKAPGTKTPKPKDDPWGSFEEKPKTKNTQSTAQSKQNDGWGGSQEKPIVDDGWGSPTITEDTSKKSGNDGWGSFQQTAADTYTSAPMPPITGPVLVLTKADLNFVSVHDSATMKEASGSLLLTSGIFVGNGGKFDWSNAGMPDVYVDMSVYQLQVKKSQFSAENVTLHYPNRVEKPVTGIFEFASKKHSSPEKAEYPRFTSLHNNIVIKNLGPNIIYKGGLSLVGRKIFSNSLYGGVCSLDYIKDSQVKFKTRGKQYQFLDSTITGQHISVSIPMRRDSIYHPATRLTYNPTTQMLRLNQSKDGFQNTPYMNSFHKVDLVVDGLQWHPDSTEINFYTLTARMEVPAIMESHDFYDSTRYFNLRGMYTFHPLQILASQAKKKNRNSFTIAELASFYKLNPSVVRNAMIRMMQSGFVDYNTDKDEVKLTRKGDHNVLVGLRKRDYDSFVINSYVQDKPNATLDLNTNTLTVRGIEKFPLSEKLEVYVLPRNKEIQLLKDRNFLLEGEVQAGNFRFKGSGFSFLYDEFTVEMNQIDTILFTPKEARGKADSIQLGSEIRYSAGTLYINKPDNKAGLKDYPEYPRLNVQSGAAIYFDQKDRQRGSYNRNVRFEIPSITLDSLNSKNPEYRGTFYSDGIFPEFQENLIAMPDNSLGFRHKVESGSLPLFGEEDSRMIFASDLTMDRKGLLASGRIDHLNTTLTAKDILFTPDSVVAKGPQADIREAMLGKVNVPKSSVKDFKLVWKAKVDSMMLSNTKSPFEIYKETGASFSGTMVVRKTGLFGNGQFDRSDSEINSPAFSFEKTRFGADNAEFRIKSNNITKPSLLANYVNINFDMGKGMAEIKTSEDPDLIGYASIEFPYCEYKTSINKATWLLDKKLVLMEGDVNTSTFTSTNPIHEGLTFNARVAGYNIQKMTLSVSGIPYIISADARIYPNKNVVMITENGNMQPLSKAVLTLDTTMSYHKLIDGEIQILSRKKFIGNATYNYTNFEKQTFNVKMKDFETRTDEPKHRKDVPLQYTAATGTVDEEDKFYLTSRMLFKGAITMKSPRKYLDLDGFVKLDLKSTNSLADWIPYKSKPEDEGVTIDVDENLKSDNVQMTVGVHVDKETSSVYTTFISAKSHPDDKDIFSAVGHLTQNDAGTQFTVADPARAKNHSLAGNQFVLDDTLGIASLEGNFSLFTNEGNNYLPVCAGLGEINLKSNAFAFNTLMGWNFPASIQIFDEMAGGIMVAKENENVGQTAAETNKENLIIKLAQVIGDKEAQGLKDKLSLGYVALPELSKRFALPLVLSKVDLHWDEESKSFGSVGKIGLSNIGNADINSEFDGMVEIRKLSQGDQVTIFLQITPEKWYYLNYQQGTLSLLSSEENFNGVVSAKGKGGKSFSVVTATEDAIDGFQDHFREVHQKNAAEPKEKITIKKAPPKIEEKKEEKTPEETLKESNTDPLSEEETTEEKPKKEPKKVKEKKKKESKPVDPTKTEDSKKKKEDKPKKESKTKPVEEEEEGDGF